MAEKTPPVSMQVFFPNNLQPGYPPPPRVGLTTPNGKPMPSPFAYQCALAAARARGAANEP